jgi:hypothetical protein
MQLSNGPPGTFKMVLLVCLTFDYARANLKKYATTPCSYFLMGVFVS